MFGNMNKTQEDFAEARKICGEHPECIGCPMTGSQPLEIENRKVYCETGKDKKTQRGE